MTSVLRIELLLEIYEDLGDGKYQEVNLVKTDEFLAVPQAGQFVCLDPGNNRHWARVTMAVLQPVTQGDLHPTAAWVYCELKKGDPYWQSNDVTSKTLEEEFGWEIS